MWPYQQQAPPSHRGGYPPHNPVHHQTYYQAPGTVNPDDLSHAAEQWARMQAPEPVPPQYPPYAQQQPDPQWAAAPHYGPPPQHYPPNPENHHYPLYPPPGGHAPPSYPGPRHLTPGILPNPPGGPGGGPPVPFRPEQYQGPPAGQQPYQGPPAGQQPPRYPHGILAAPQGRPPEPYNPHDPYATPHAPWQPPAGPPGGQHYAAPPPVMETAPVEHATIPYYNYTLEGNLEYVEGNGGGDYSGGYEQYAGFDFEGYQVQSAEALKKLPPWIREGLEKLEREKQKEREKQRFMQEYESRVKEETAEVAKSGRSRFSSSSPSSRGSSASPDNRKRAVEEEEAEELNLEWDRPLTEEEREKLAIAATKQLVTTILMKSTSGVLEKACLEEIEERKSVLKQLASQPVRVSAALASLAQFGSSSSDSDSDEEKLPPPPPGTLKTLSTAQKPSDHVPSTAPLVARRSASHSRSPSPPPKLQSKQTLKPLPKGSPIVKAKNGSPSPPRTKKATSPVRKAVLERGRRQSSSSESDSRERGHRAGQSSSRPHQPSSTKKSASPPRNRASSPSSHKKDRTSSVGSSYRDDTRRPRRSPSPLRHSPKISKSNNSKSDERRKRTRSSSDEEKTRIRSRTPEKTSKNQTSKNRHSAAASAESELRDGKSTRKVDEKSRPERKPHESDRIRDESEEKRSSKKSFQNRHAVKPASDSDSFDDDAARKSAGKSKESGKSRDSGRRDSSGGSRDRQRYS